MSDTRCRLVIIILKNEEKRGMKEASKHVTKLLRSRNLSPSLIHFNFHDTSTLKRFYLTKIIQALSLIYIYIYNSQKGVDYPRRIEKRRSV